MNKKFLDKLPVAISSFPTLRANKQIYVDKTKLLNQLANERKSFLLTRPAGFGKSLLISTIGSLFRSGLKDFEGLKIAKTWKEPHTFPVATIDFSGLQDFKTITEFKQGLLTTVTKAFGEIGFPYTEDSSFTLYEQVSEWLFRFMEESIVLLIDDYDAPLRSCLDNSDLFQEVAHELSQFFEAVKENQATFRFALVTGEFRFGNQALSTAMENFQDISQESEYATLLGFTDNEIKSYFQTYINRGNEIKQWEGGVLQELQGKFGGFAFSQYAKQTVTNPGQFIKCLASVEDKPTLTELGNSQKISWMRKVLGTKAFLDPAKYVEPMPFDPTQLSNCGIPSQFNIPIFLFQLGYLTFEGSNPGAFLDYPNFGVADWMANLYEECLTGERWEVDPYEKDVMITKFKNEAYSGIIKRLNNVVQPMKPGENVSITTEYALGAVLIAFKILGLEPKVFKSADNRITDFMIEVISDRWTFAVFLDEGKPDFDSFNALKAKLKQAQMRSKGVKNVKAIIVFSKKERRIVGLEVVDCVTFNPKALLGMCFNPTQIGPLVFPDYASVFWPENFFRKR